MKKRSLIISIASLLIVCLVGTSVAFAISDANKLKNIEQKKADAQKSLAQVEEEVDALCDELDAIDKKVDAKKVEYNKAAKEVRDVKKKIKDRKEGLDARLRAMYKNGTVGYIEVLLGSHSITEFISNVEMIKRIYKNDQTVLENLKTQKIELEEKEKKLASEKKKLEDLQAQSKAKEKALKEKCARYKSQIATLARQEEEVRADIAAKQDGTRIYSGGAFAWPTTTKLITSYFGMRVHPVYGYRTGHAGIDIGVSYSSVYAAASGKVIVAQSGYGGYGKAIAIDHGSGIVSLYGHLSNIKVRVGQNVSKGQVIAVSGNTGVSTGPHLHFEIRVNGSPVNPLKYY